jgi:carboxyl-terminal processing protease
VALLVVLSFALGYAAHRSPAGGVVDEARARIIDLSLTQPSPAVLDRAAVEGLIKGLNDPYAAYLPAGNGKAAKDPAERAVGLTNESSKRAAGVSARMLSPSTAYVALHLFTQGSANLVRDKVRSLQNEGAKGIVLDLRANPGGLVNEAVDVAGMIIGNKPVFKYKQRSGHGGVRKGTGGQIHGLQWAILVDGGSASASELVAGAVQDAGGGVVVGEKTKGKGTVQRVVGLSDGAALKITTESYTTPKGRIVAGKGIEPDVVVHDPQQQLERARSIVEAAP